MANAAPGPSLVGLLGSITTQSGAGFGAGWALSAQNPAGVTMFTLIASLVMAFDFAGYRSSADLGNRFVWTAIAGAVATGAALIPYFAMSKGTKNKKVGTSAIPVACATWMAVMLGFGVFFAKGGASFMGPLQGMIISLMYMILASFMGYNMNASKKDPKARGSTLFALAIYVLLFAFDLAGFKQTSGSNKGNGKGASVNKPPASVNLPAMGVSGSGNLPVEPGAGAVVA